MYRFNWLDAAKIPQEDRDRRVQQVKEYMEKNPKEPYYYLHSADCMVVGFRHDDGSFIVYDTLPVTSYERIGED